MGFTDIIVTRDYNLAQQDIPPTGTVIFTPAVPMVNGSITVASVPVTATLDGVGQISIPLAATDDPGTSPSGASYHVEERITGQVRRFYYVEIPYDAAGGTVDLGTLMVAAVPPVVTYPVPGPQGPQGDPGPTGPAGAPGVSGDHSMLSNLDEDDHPHYHTDARGDVRYYTKTQTDAAYQPVDGDLSAVAALAPANDDVIQRKAGAWANRTLAQLADDLDAFLQPLDGDLTTIAGLTATTDNFLQAKAGAWASRTPAQVATDLSGHLQPLDSDLTAFAALAPSDGVLLRRVAGAWAAYTLSASDVGTGTLPAARLPRVPAVITAVSHSVAGALTTTDANSGGPMIVNVTMTANITSVAAPSNPTDGQIIRYRFFASGGARTVTVAAAIRTSTGLTRGAHSVPSGEIMEMTIEYQGLVSAWAMTAYTITAA